MPLTLYIAEDNQKRMIERTAKKVANSRAKSLRTDRYRLFLYGFIVNYFNFVYQ
jgi:hypothetical protein